MLPDGGACLLGGKIRALPATVLGLLLCVRVGRKAEIVSRPPQSPGGETKAQRGAVPGLEPCQVIVTHLLLELLDLDPEGWVGSV